MYHFYFKKPAFKRSSTQQLKFGVESFVKALKI